MQWRFLYFYVVDLFYFLNFLSCFKGLGGSVGCTFDVIHVNFTLFLACNLCYYDIQLTLLLSFYGNFIIIIIIFHVSFYFYFSYHNPVYHYPHHLQCAYNFVRRHFLPNAFYILFHSPVFITTKIFLYFNVSNYISPTISSPPW